MPSHYIYYALGFRLDSFAIKLFLAGQVEAAMQAYVGVRTGILPDNKYKTSSQNKLWAYLCKEPIAAFETRQEANDAEYNLLKACLCTCWELLANNVISNGGFLPGKANCIHLPHIKESTKKQQKQQWQDLR